MKSVGLIGRNHVTPCSLVETDSVLRERTASIVRIATLKMQAENASETWLNCYHSTRYHMPELGGTPSLLLTSTPSIRSNAMGILENYWDNGAGE